MNDLRDVDPRALHQGIFSRTELPDDPFLHATWQVVLLPYGVHLDRPTFDALARAATVVNDLSFYAIEIESIDIPHEPLEMEWSFQVFDRIRHESQHLLGVLDSHWFGRSAAWGALSACSMDDVLCVGGTAEFMTSLVASLGGPSRIREQFEQFARTEWSVADAIKSRLLEVSARSQF